MIEYGNTKLKVKDLSITKKKEQEIRHYPNTDNNDVISKGRPATEITCKLKATSESEKILLEQLLHQEGITRELHFGSYYYKDVTTEPGSEEPITHNQQHWWLDANFIALDPVPYDSDTGEALY